MTIVTVGNTKGGVGKTTIALNLAAARALGGRDVWLVDGDRQGTAQKAITIRSDTEPTPVNIACASYPDGPALRSQVLMQRSRFDDVVIDVGGRDSGALRAALHLTDVLLIPIRPRSFEVWALDDIAKLIEEARSQRDDLVAYAFLNQADPGDGSADDREAAAAAAEFSQFKFLDTPMRLRKAIANAAGAGLSVLEARPVNRKAVNELEALVAAVYGRVDL